MRFLIHIVVIVLALCQLGATYTEHAEALDTDDFQLDLPNAPKCPTGFENRDGYCRTIDYDNQLTTSWTIDDPDDEFSLPKFDIPDSWDFGALAGIVIMSMIAFMLAILLIFIVRRTSRSRIVAEADEGAGLVGALRKKTENRSHATLADLNAFDAAIHALLLEIVEHIFWRRPELNKPSITGREISNSYRDDVAVGVDLERLIMRVELSRFARVPATETDYEEALAWHARLMQQLGVKHD